MKKQKEKEKIEQQKRDGTYLTKAQREEKLRNEMKLKQTYPILRSQWLVMTRKSQRNCEQAEDVMIM